MNVELLKRKTYWELQSSIDKYIEFNKIDISGLSNQIKELIDAGETCGKMITDKEMSDSDFYKSLKEFAFIIDWDENDFKNIVAKYYGWNFAGYATIKTKMHKQINSLGGHKKSHKEAGVNYKVLYTEDANIDINHIYSIEEVQKLLDEKKIVIVLEEERKVHGKKDEKEDYFAFESAYDRGTIVPLFLSDGGKYYSYTLKYIRNYLTGDKLKELYIGHIDHINTQVCAATNGEHEEFIAWQEIADECSKEFNNCGYTRRLVKLNEDKEKYI